MSVNNSSYFRNPNVYPTARPNHVIRNKENYQFHPGHCPKIQGGFQKIIKHIMLNFFPKAPLSNMNRSRIGEGSVAAARLAEPRLWKPWLVPWAARLPGRAVFIDSARIGSRADHIGLAQFQGGLSRVLVAGAKCC